MTTHSAARYDHDTKYDNDFISGLVPNLVQRSLIGKTAHREGVCTLVEYRLYAFAHHC